jgi:CheY-like chemotaxis protein
MAETKPIRILLIEDNRDFANLVDLFLGKHEGGTFSVAWKTNGPGALEELEKDRSFDVILMDYFLPGMNGIEITQALQERGINIPVIFLTVNKDFDLAVEVLKLGVEDYLVKEEITTPVLPHTILNAIERKRLRDQMTTLEISGKRLDAIRKLVSHITGEVRLPLDSIRKQVEELSRLHPDDALTSYLKIIKDNLDRIDAKIFRLKELKSDRTVTYVRDIKMIDLSQ